MTEILRVIVGSRAHHLEVEGSDYDYRSIYATPTRELLSLQPGKMATMSKGVTDETSWEVAHFLRLATGGNPTVLEVFNAPVVGSVPWGESLRELFPYVLDREKIRNAFLGYAQSQRKHFLNCSDPVRAGKFATAYLRVLYQGYMLLRYQRLPVDMRGTAIENRLREWKAGNWIAHEVIGICRSYEEGIRNLMPMPDTFNLDKVNDWLLRLRINYF